jgi:hypothetical protein
MKKNFAGILFGVLTLALLGAACAPAPGQTTQPAPITPVVGIPVTGQDITNEARFCVGNLSYDVRVMPQYTTLGTATETATATP